MRPLFLLLPFFLLATPASACSLLSWSAVENSAGILSAVEDSAHFNENCGLRVALNGSSVGYVEDQSPGKVFPVVNEYFAQFEINLTELDLSSGESLEIFSAIGDAGVRLFSLNLLLHNSEQALAIKTNDSSGNSRRVISPIATLASGWHDIKVTWRKENPVSGTKGEVLVSVDQQELSCNTAIRDINNAAQSINKIQLGVVSGNSHVITGTLDFDTFQSHRSGEVLADSCIVPRVNLPHDQWQQISIPANPGSANRVNDIFGDDLDPDQYGSDWILFSFNPATNRYENPGVNGILEQGVGYWIIQLTGDHVTLDIDSYTESVSGYRSDLFANGNTGWNMSGAIGNLDSSWEQYKIKTDTGICSEANYCSIATAYSEGIFHNQAWSYNGSDYNIIESSVVVPAWSGFWGATLPAAENQSVQMVHP